MDLISNSDISQIKADERYHNTHGRIPFTEKKK